MPENESNLFHVKPPEGLQAMSISHSNHGYIGHIAPAKGQAWKVRRSCMSPLLRADITTCIFLLVASHVLQYKIHVKSYWE